MKTSHYLDCANEQLIRSKEEDQQILGMARRRRATRFMRHNPHEVVIRVVPEDFSLPYPLLLTLRLQGEIIDSSEVEIGWQHQGIEKTMEVNTWSFGRGLLRKMNPSEFSAIYIAYSLACEDMLPNREVPIYRQYHRVAGLEAERISHNWKIIFRVLRVISGFPDSARLLEIQTKSNELLSLLGGNICHASTRLEVLGCLKTLKEKMGPTLASIYDNNYLRERLLNKGKISVKSAIANGLTGIYLRACGVDTDVRTHHPQLPYAALGFKPQTLTGYDAYARFLLRIIEIESALMLLEKALNVCRDEAPRFLEEERTDPLSNEFVPDKNQVAASFLEAPEGEVAVSVCSDGSQNPYRVRIKTPSFSLTSAIPMFLQGCHIDDVVLLLNTLGINTLETDR